jgi:hypothetical protein
MMEPRISFARFSLGNKPASGGGREKLAQSRQSAIPRVACSIIEGPHGEHTRTVVVEPSRSDEWKAVNECALISSLPQRSVWHLRACVVASAAR